jgi:hypothetical protein
VSKSHIMAILIMMNTLVSEYQSRSRFKLGLGATRMPRCNSRPGTMWQPRIRKPAANESECCLQSVEKADYTEDKEGWLWAAIGVQHDDEVCSITGAAR